MAGGGTDLMYENTQMGSFNFSNLYDFFQTGGAGVMFLKISHVLETVHEYQQQPVLSALAGNAVSKETVRQLKLLHRNNFQSMTGVDQIVWAGRRLPVRVLRHVCQ